MYKLFILAAFAILSISFVNAQTQFEVSTDTDKSKLLKGIINRDILEKDTAFTKWYTESLKGYKPAPNAIAALRKNADSIELIVFMGTWCEDSHFVIPKFYNLLDQAAFPKDKVTLLAVDRNKKTLSHLAEALNIINVPTIIVMKKGKELGRVIEYGKSGLFDKDLGEILSAAH
jgi:thiol-disulfide isomerase/thioredoxin